MRYLFMLAIFIVVISLAAYGLTVSDLRSESGVDIRILYLDAMITWAMEMKDIVSEEKQITNALENRGLVTAAQKLAIYTKYDQLLEQKIQEQPTLAAIRQQYIDAKEQQAIEDGLAQDGLAQDAK